MILTVFLYEKREEKDWKLLPLLEAYQAPVPLESFPYRMRQGNYFGKIPASLKLSSKGKSMGGLLPLPSLLPVSFCSSQGSRWMPQEVQRMPGTTERQWDLHGNGKIPG